MAKSNKKQYIYAVGKRKTASARVRLIKGVGQNMINDMPLEKYFPGLINKSYWSQPFELTETVNKFYATIKVNGGGKSNQLDAVIHGISRAFAKSNPEKFRSILKKSGLLTRDSRERERRKVGTGGKARRKKQSPKR